MVYFHREASVFSGYLISKAEQAPKGHGKAKEMLDFLKNFVDEADKNEALTPLKWAEDDKDNKAFTSITYLNEKDTLICVSLVTQKIKEQYENKIKNSFFSPLIKFFYKKKIKEVTDEANDIITRCTKLLTNIQKEELKGNMPKPYSGNDKPGFNNPPSGLEKYMELNIPKPEIPPNK